jgi:hypothetical protein
MNTKVAIPNTTKEVRYQIRLDLVGRVVLLLLVEAVKMSSDLIIRSRSNSWAE